MKDNLKVCLIVMSIAIPGMGLLYSVLKNKELEKDNNELIRQNKRLEARTEVLEQQNRELFKIIDKDDSK